MRRMQSLQAFGQRIRCCVALVACVWLVIGCADSEAPSHGGSFPQDAAFDAQVGEDAGRDLELDQGLDQALPEDGGPNPCPGERADFQSCCKAQDCLSGYCVEGEQGQVCTHPCNDNTDCPPDWECRRLSTGGPDVVRVCLYEPIICQPCEKHEDCRGEDNLCLLIGDRRYCALACRAPADCPAGYACQDPDPEDGSELWQCLPVSGWCGPCRDEDGDRFHAGDGCPDATDCDDQNELIFPRAAETCDGRDNDCDGTTDEDFRLATDPEHCGSCGRSCATPHAVMACRSGECVLERCDEFFHDLDPREPGCEYFCPDELEQGEICDERDNDCDGQRDENFDLTQDEENCGWCGNRCAPASCGRRGEEFLLTAAADCENSRCHTPRAVSCGQYTCEGGESGVDCARSCVDDTRCVAAAHCANGACVPDLANGAPCQEDRDCGSNHCGNGFCCASGDCCSQAADCPASFSEPPACIVPSACQGRRLDPVCNPDFRCQSLTVEDDRACQAEVLADECGLFLPIFCTGEAEQLDQPCPLACESHEECDPGAHCDGQCVRDREDGEACDQDFDCAGQRCANGYCCSEGDCCSQSADCPREYFPIPVCDDPVRCQGHRVDVLCTAESSCLAIPVDDDQACAAQLLAHDCGPYPALSCNGADLQEPQTCADTCIWNQDADCDPEAHCDDDRCVWDLADGESCDEDSDCTSNHCGNGFCCREGDCCAQVADCPATWWASASCVEPFACQGYRLDARCTAEFRCASARIEDDSACTAEVIADPCGWFLDRLCTGEPEQQPEACPIACVEDGACEPGAHCDGSCRPDLPDGRACNSHNECISKHCQNHFCCSQGDCCLTADSCPELYRSPPTCSDVAGCQGYRLEATCINSSCGVSEPIDDDRGCGPGQIALECGLYLPIRCDGLPDQTPPRCPAHCSANEECIQGAHCNGECVADMPGGQPCLGNADCVSRHCQNGFCCIEGDCCGVAADCPDRYRAEPVCDDASSCQGHRVDAVCTGLHSCTARETPDDSACRPELLSDGCGPYPAIYCTGELEQPDPACPIRCETDEQCDAEAYCTANNICAPDEPDGRPCDAATDCRSGHCQNGFCCSGGDCCANAASCPRERYAQPPLCTDPSSCQGQRQDPVCVDSVCAVGPLVDDDSACTAATASDHCGPYPTIYCNGASVQLDPPCPNSCGSHAQCDADAHCDQGSCETDHGNGGRCGDPVECQSNRCVDGVCCGSACNALCQRCDLNGDGACANLGAGLDPDNECAGFSCSNYYWGWEGNTCYRRADAGAAAVACNGGGACQGQAEVCPTAGRGAPALTCDATCQQPVAGSCNGTTAGTCQNLDLGNHTCGVGACQRSVPKCVNGRLNPCVPGAPGSESCNNLDDDCNSTVDDNIVGLGDDAGNSCGGYTELGNVAEESGEQSWSRRLYPANDQDGFRFTAVEKSDVCFPGVGEDLYIRVRLVPPQGADCRDFDLILYDDGCNELGRSSLAGCSAESITHKWGGRCAWDDDRTFRVVVFGYGGTWECAPYTLYADMNP